LSYYSRETIKKEGKQDKQLPSLLSVVRDESVQLIQEAFSEEKGLKWTVGKDCSKKIKTY
jgi:hypothetical protein